MFKTILNKFKKSVKAEQKPVFKKNPNFIADADIPSQCENGMIMHNCGYDEEKQAYRIVYNDVMSVRLYADMIKEFATTIKK